MKTNFYRRNISLAVSYYIGKEQGEVIAKLFMRRYGNIWDAEAALIPLDTTPDGVDLNNKADQIEAQLETHLACLALEGEVDYHVDLEWLGWETEPMVFFYHPDHLGSSSFITGATGEPTQHLEYLPFGELFIEERSTWNTPYKFSGKELDDETGYSYFGARYYDPNISIWLSVDPLASAFPGWSPYSYTYNNPVNFIDEFGLWGEKKAQRKHEKAVNKYGPENVGHVYKNKEGEYGFNVSKTGFKQYSGDEIPAGTHAYADGGEAMFTDRSMSNYEAYGHDYGLNWAERGLVGFLSLLAFDIDFYSGALGGPTGNEAELSDKAGYLAMTFMLGSIKLPSKGTYRYKPAKSWRQINKPQMKNGAAIDYLGNLWVKGKGNNIQGEMHFDVTLSKKGKQRWGITDDHINVNQNGEICH